MCSVMDILDIKIYYSRKNTSNDINDGSIIFGSTT